MDEQEHKDFLTGIAKEVGKLIVKPANLNRFRQQDRIFWELCKVSCQAMEQDRQAAESNPRLRDKQAGPPKKDWVWYDQERSKTIPKGYWRRPDKDLPPNPVDWLSLPSFTNEIVPGMFSTQCQTPETEEIVLPYYALLTIIHDNEKIDNIQINNGIWSEDEGWVSLILDELNWHNLMEWHVGNRLRSYIELALEHVKTDLAKESGETDPSTTPAKEELEKAKTIGSIKMKESSEAKSKRTPGLLTGGRVEIFAIPPSIKRMARGRKIDIWTHPFKCGLSAATEEVISENPEKVAFSQRLTKMELEVIKKAVGSLNMSHIKSFLMQMCNVSDLTNLTWTEILSHLEVYLHSQKAEQPAEIEQEIKSVKKPSESMTEKDRQLFSQIAIDVRGHPNRYSRAGKCLDKYCREEEYWQWKEDELKKAIDKYENTANPKLKRHIEKLKKYIGKRQVSRRARFNEARHYWLDKYEEQNFMSEDDARCIILITWLLTDPDTENTNLNITEFAKWSWEPTDDIVSDSRCAASLLWQQSSNAYRLWMEPVRKAWKLLEAEKPADRKATIAAIIISFMMILLFELLVHVGPLSWFKNHPNSYSLQGSIICLIPCLLVGLFKRQWRKWCWGVAGLAFLGIVLSLLGGRSRQ